MAIRNNSLYRLYFVLIVILLLAAFAPSVAIVSEEDNSANQIESDWTDTALGRELYRELTDRIIQLRCTRGLDWDEVMSTVAEDEMQGLVWFAGSAPGLGLTQLITCELLLRYERSTGTAADSFLEDKSTLWLWYKFFSHKDDYVQREAFRMIYPEGPFNEYEAVRNLVLYGKESAKEKIDLVGELCLAKRPFVELVGLMRYIVLVDPQFAQSLAVYLYEAEPDYQPQMTYFTHFSIVIALLIGADYEIDPESVANRVDIEDMAIYLPEDVYQQAATQLEPFVKAPYLDGE